MNHPHKKLKTDGASDNAQLKSPQSPEREAKVQVPASSPAVHTAGRPETGTISPGYNGNRKRDASVIGPSSDDESKVGEHRKGQSSSASEPQSRPMVPNVSMRKAAFPSRQKMQEQLHTGPATNLTRTNSPSSYPNSSPGPTILKASQASMSPATQQMRQHVQTFQYSPNQNLAHQPNHPAHSGYVPPGYPTPQSSHQFYGQAGQQVSTPYHAPHQTSSPSMADQYDAGRSRPRLVQRLPNQANQYQGQPAMYPSYQQMAGQQYAATSQFQTGPYAGQQTMYANSPHRSQSQAPVDPASVAKLSEVFPHLPDAILKKALLQARGNAEDAQALIADDRVTIDLSESTQAPHPQAIYSVPHHGYPNMMSGMPHTNRQHEQPVQRALPVSTKREVKAPNLSIREKQAMRTAQTYPGQFHPQAQSQYRYQNPYAVNQQHQQQQQQQQQMFHLQQQQRYQQQQQYMRNQRAQVEAPIYEAPKLRTRVAKKGPKIEIGSDESEDDAAVELDSEGQDETDRESDEEDGEAEVGVYLDFDRVALESRVLYYMNTVSTAKELADLASCTEDVATFIIGSRPFDNLDRVRDLDQLPEGKRPSRTRKTIGAKAVEMAVDAMEGYEAIDSLVARCEDYGRTVKDAMRNWGIDVESADDNDGAMDVVKIDATAAASVSTEIAYLKDQPTLLPEGMKLKDYQLFGVNWLHLMYQKKLSGILADEMGLGKTCQVISFLGVLLEKGFAGPHLIVVPASTLENWLREISRFCPSLKVEAYYGSQRERNEFRDEFEGEGKRDFNIMVTTYQLATGAKDDRAFLKRQAFDACVYDEGHNLKNSASSRYKYLMALKANFRLLLTGTPLQNNLKELISLLAFVLPKVFAGNVDRLDSIFKIKAFGDSESLESALLSKQRIKRAKTMMTPFILRRYKKDVLDDLPPKKYRIDYVELNEAQKEIYNEHLGTTRKALEAKYNGVDVPTKDIKSAVNVMMQLRKCSNHPMLFRRQFDDKMLKKMAKNILKEDVFKDSDEKIVIEDMEVMTDFELNRLCLRYPKINSFALEQDCWMDACKVQHLRKIIPEMKKNGDRILLFSQFTQTLDILENCMDTMGISYFRLDGSTDVSARQDLIDQFYAEPDITVFLLSTKAGGFGINLACANVVIIYDSSFNPHDDKQAEDRAHRVGQKKEVQIIRIVTKNTIEEHIVKLANTKLTLDSSVSGDIEVDAKAIEAHGEKQIAQTLISQLRQQ